MGIHELETQIDDALQCLGILRSDFLRIPESSAAQILQEVREKFVSGTTKTWWHSLRSPKRVIEFPDATGYNHLAEHIPRGDDRCWFIPGSDGEDPAVYDVLVSVLSKVLNECGFFEYYLVGKHFDWLIVENDHNQLIIVGMECQ